MPEVKGRLLLWCPVSCTCATKQLRRPCRALVKITKVGDSWGP